MWLQNGYSYQITLAFPFLWCYYNDNERGSEPAAEKLAGCQKLAIRTLIIEYPFLGNDTILAKYAKMAKAGACQKMEKLAVVAKEQYPKIGNPILYRKWKRGNKNAI